MREKIWDTGALSLENLKAKPVRAACLALVAAVLAFVLFGGSLLALNLRQGLDAVTRRFGADLMVVPQGAGEQAQASLLKGSINHFYFDSRVADAVAGIEGVAGASPQFYLASLATECCDAPVQLIAYDPATDFVVQPWVAEKHPAAVGESALAGLAGGAAGILVASLGAFPFSALIGERLGLPYLDAPLLYIIPLALGSLVLSALAAPWLRSIRPIRSAGRKPILPCGRANDGAS
jgi:putative ABC transport system permease protein